MSMTAAEKAELAKLREENEKLKARAQSNGKITLKVSAKGAVSAYGLGRWPVTLYAGQWTRLLAESKAIAQFIETNKSSLAVKE